MRKLWDMKIMYKKRVKGEVTVGAVHVVEDGAAGYGIWGRYDPPKLCVSRSFFVFMLLCQGKGGGRHERGAAKRG